MQRGWIKLHRAVLEHWVFQDPLLLKMWMYILLTANHEDHKILINKELTTIFRGQFWTSIRKLSIALSIDKNTANKYLNLLQSDGMIYVDSRKGIGTLITVRKYEEYQAFPDTVSDTASDTPSYTASDTASDTMRTQLQTRFHHKQEYKNIRMNKNEKKKDSPGDPDYMEEV